MSKLAAGDRCPIYVTSLWSVTIHCSFDSTSRWMRGGPVFLLAELVFLCQDLSSFTNCVAPWLELGTWFGEI